MPKLRVSSLPLLLTVLVVVAPLPQAPAEKDQSSKPFNGLKYRSIGPAAGGRVSRVAGVPGDPTVYYAATASGGVWKTTDSGTTWKSASSAFHTSTATKQTIKNLTNGTKYVFRVAAINAIGKGAYSGKSNAVTPVADPSQLTAGKATSNPASRRRRWSMVRTAGSSSAIRTRGRQEIAMAIMTRWRMPPESSCG